MSVIIQHKANTLELLEKANSSDIVDIIEIDLSYSFLRMELVLNHDPDKTSDTCIALSDLPKLNKPLMLDLKVDPQYSEEYLKILLNYISTSTFTSTLYIASFNHYFIAEIQSKISNKNNIKFGLIIHSCFSGMNNIIPEYIDFVNLNNYNYLPEVRDELIEIPNIFLYTNNSTNSGDF